jgi:hypothetical protein
LTGGCLPAALRLRKRNRNRQLEHLLTVLDLEVDLESGRWRGLVVDRGGLTHRAIGLEAKQFRSDQYFFQIPNHDVRSIELVSFDQDLITVFNVAHFDMQIKYCGMEIEAMDLETVNAQFDACISQAICEIAVQEAEDLTFGFLGAALGEEEKAITELVQLMYSGAEYGIASPTDALCGEPD